MLPGIAIRQFPIDAIEPGATVAPRVLFEGRAPFYTIDNMEGIAVSRSADGETRLTLISDDNFRRDMQRTLLLQFALAGVIAASSTPRAAIRRSDAACPPHAGPE